MRGNIPRDPSFVKVLNPDSIVCSLLSPNLHESYAHAISAEGLSRWWEPSQAPARLSPRILGKIDCPPRGLHAAAHNPFHLSATWRVISWGQGWLRLLDQCVHYGHHWRLGLRTKLWWPWKWQDRSLATGRVWEHQGWVPIGWSTVLNFEVCYLVSAPDQKAVQRSPTIRGRCGATKDEHGNRQIRSVFQPAHQSRSRQNKRQWNCRIRCPFHRWW